MKNLKKFNEFSIISENADIYKHELPSAIEQYVEEIENFKNIKDYKKLLSKIKEELSDETYDKLSKMKDNELIDIINKSILYI